MLIENIISLDVISSHLIFIVIYRSAFFHAQIEQPVRGLMSLFNQQDESVLVAINERGVFIIDHIASVSKHQISNKSLKCNLH